MALKGTDSNKPSGKGGIVVIAAGIVVIIALIVTVVVLLQRNQKDEAASTPLRNRVVSEENVDEIITELQQERVKPGSYEVTMNSTWTFEDGESQSDNAYVENAVTNTNDVYFDINRSDTDELIYSSPILPVGSHLEEITLDKILPAGTYDCVLTYHLVDEEQNTLSTLRMGLTIVVNN